ncbi:cysteine and glycine-rich protein [Mytilus galloprovincialis]|uniref:Cysteine and glycine-rich protein n=1 Tax=Mytilus galloprovincialis TaxID=29158 RepID=A0A8B6HG08_MYTGA|nr:cysteine and glycine-rich protein [Mytilus galloprovincialis]
MLAQGGGALSLENRINKFGNKDSEMSNRPREQHVGPSNSGPGPHCPRCGKTVYEAERAIGLTDDVMQRTLDLMDLVLDHWLNNCEQDCLRHST